MCYSVIQNNETQAWKPATTRYTYFDKLTIYM